MKKQLINEAFRLQQLAGIEPINSLNEEDNTSDKKVVYQDEENRLILDKDVDGTYYLVNDFHDEDWDVWTEYETEPSEEQIKLDVEDYLSQR
jgi:hypothetical protein